MKTKTKAKPVRRVRRAKLTGDTIYFDCETTGLDVWHGDQPFSVQMCDREGTTRYWEWPVDPYTRAVEADPLDLEEIAELLGRPVRKVGHNVKFDVRMLDVAYGIKVAGDIRDTMFMAHACNTAEISYKLKPLAWRKVKFPMNDLDELHAIVLKCRRWADKLGWELAFDWKLNPDGTFKKEAVVEADYWLPSAVARLLPGRLSPQEVKANQEYGCNDVLRCAVLDAFYEPELERLDVNWIYEMESKLWHTTYKMEERGVRCSKDVVRREMENSLEQLRRNLSQLEEAAWPGFNVNSPIQLGKLFFDKLKLKCRTHTDNMNVRCPYCGRRGNPQVNYDSLEDRSDLPVVQALFKYKSAHKAYTSFFRRYWDAIVDDPIAPGFSCLHADFNQVGPVTGRFSCRNPNLQNVGNALTTRSSEPVQARTPFGPRPGYRWYHIDYSQLEVRVFADVSQEPTMLAALSQEGRDLHTECANKAWGGETETAIRAAFHALELDGTSDHSNEFVRAIWKAMGVSDRSAYKLRWRVAEQWFETFNFDIVAAEKSLDKKGSRAKAKMVLFLKVFGGGEDALAKLLKCSVEDAAEFLGDYDTAFPRIVEFIDETSSLARKQGYIRSRYGRRITVDRDAPYTAVNYLVQGSAADLMKVSMIKCDAFLAATELDAHIVMTIHDELVFEIRKEHAYKELLRGLCELMADHGGRFGVETPVEVDRCIERWNDKVKVEL